MYNSYYFVSFCLSYFYNQFGIADPEMAPWQALIHVASASEERMCAGVIADKRHIITIASCLLTVGLDDVQAVSP